MRNVDRTPADAFDTLEKESDESRMQKHQWLTGALHSVDNFKAHLETCVREIDAFFLKAAVMFLDKTPEEDSPLNRPRLRADKLSKIVDLTEDLRRKQSILIRLHDELEGSLKKVDRDVSRGLSSPRSLQEN